MSVTFVVHWLDVGPNLISGQRPVYLLERPLPASARGDPHGPGFNVAEVARLGCFWVPQLDVFQDDPVWSCTRTGQWVRVPLTSYRTDRRDLAHVWGLGVQVGLAALASYWQRGGTAPERIHLVLGTDCTDLHPDDAVRAYLGLALAVKE